jgi:hypothetical protein
MRLKPLLKKSGPLRKERGKPVHKVIPLNLDGYERAREKPPRSRL